MKIPQHTERAASHPLFMHIQTLGRHIRLLRREESALRQESPTFCLAPGDLRHQFAADPSRQWLQTMARPRPLPALEEFVRSKRSVRCSSTSPGMTRAFIGNGKADIRRQFHLYRRVRRSVLRNAFSIRFLMTIPNASGSKSDMTGRSGRESARRSVGRMPCEIPRRPGRTSLFSDRPLVQTRRRPPSARAICISLSDTRVKRFSEVSISAARCPAIGSEVSDCMPLSLGDSLPQARVRNSCAAFAAKLRSCIKSTPSARDSSAFNVSATGAISARKIARLHRRQIAGAAGSQSVPEIGVPVPGCGAGQGRRRSE